MAERRKNLLKAGLIIALGGLSYAAIKKLPSSEEVILSTTRRALRYDDRVTDGTVDSILQKIPGHLAVSEFIAEALSDKEHDWHATNPTNFRLYMDPNYFHVDCRPSAIGPELLIARAFAAPKPDATLRWGITRDARTDFWIIGNRFDPSTSRSQLVY